MIRLPSLPFASSIATGKRHAGLTSDNDAIFNLEYFVGLHKIHHDDIPQVLTEKLAQELMECAHNMHKDLTSVLLEHMQNMEAKGIVCMPAIPSNKKGTSYITAAYHYNEDVDGVDVVVSFMNGKSKEAVETPFLTFTAERLPDGSEFFLDIPNEIAIPLMLKLGWTRDKLHEKAKRYLNIVCLFEAMFDYNIIRFQGYIYDAMLQKNGTYLNPNFIQMNLVALKDEKGIM